MHVVSGSGDYARRAAWLYLACIAFGLVATSIAVVVLVLLGGRKPPDSISSENSKNLFFFREKKLARVESISSPKLVVISGSSGLSSLRSEIIEGFFGAPTVNLGLQAGLGLDYILYDAGRVLRHGDTALLVLEYEHFMDTGERGWSQADFTLHHDPIWIRMIRPARALALVKLLSGREWMGVLWRGVWSRPVDPSPYVAALNERGDVIVNTKERAHLVAGRLAEYKSPMSFPGAELSEFSRREIGAFAARCRERGVTVVAAPPPFIEFPAYQTNGFFEFIGAIRGLYDSLGIEVLDVPRAGLFERDQFFDTWYHLNSEAAVTYSEALAHALSAVPRYEASFQAGIDLSRPGLPYFVQSVKGLSAREPWGRWSDAKKVEWRFSRRPPQPLHLIVELQAFGPNLGRDMTIRYGTQVRSVRLESTALREVEVRFEGVEDSLEMEWVIPEPQAPSEVIAGSKDARTLGVGARRIRFSS